MEKLFQGKLSDSSEVVCVIMAGGSGTRFWPLSRSALPKQFLNLAGGSESLLQETASRMSGLSREADILLATGKRFVELSREHLPSAAILAEPVAKNTAPCLAYAAALVQKYKGDVPMVCLPADHVFSNPDNLLRLLDTAVSYANSEDKLVTIGIQPDKPETGYGYIKFDNAPGASGECEVSEFVEKPDLDTAKAYLDAGNYYWNSGIFVWRTSVFLRALEKTMPGLAAAVPELIEAFGKEDELSRVESIFSNIESESIDFGMMEKADNVVMMLGDDLGWSDIGSWDAWDAYCQKVAGQDLPRSRPEGLVEVDGENNAVFSSSGKVVSLIGLSDLVVVDTDDAILVCPKDRSQDVKAALKLMGERGKTEVL